MLYKERKKKNQTKNFCWSQEGCLTEEIVFLSAKGAGQKNKRQISEDLELSLKSGILANRRT